MIFYSNRIKPKNFFGIPARFDVTDPYSVYRAKHYVYQFTRIGDILMTKCPQYHGFLRATLLDWDLPTSRQHVSHVGWYNRTKQLVDLLEKGRPAEESEDDYLLKKKIFADKVHRVYRSFLENLPCEQIYLYIEPTERYLRIIVKNITKADMCLILQLFEHIKLNLLFKFNFLDLAVVDRLGSKQISSINRFLLNYVFYSDKLKTRLIIGVPLAEHASMETITHIYPSALWPEREAMEMYGIRFNNHEDPRRLLTDYGVRITPMRKDFPPVGYEEVSYSEKDVSVRYHKIVLPQYDRSSDVDTLTVWGSRYSEDGSLAAMERTNKEKLTQTYDFLSKLLSFDNNGDPAELVSFFHADPVFFPTSSSNVLEDYSVQLVGCNDLSKLQYQNKLYLSWLYGKDTVHYTRDLKKLQRLRSALFKIPNFVLIAKKYRSKAKWYHFYKRNLLTKAQLEIFYKDWENQKYLWDSTVLAAFRPCVRHLKYMNISYMWFRFSTLNRDNEHKIRLGLQRMAENFENESIHSSKKKLN
jgi:NADH:ubiquinone oxidoreductase subunit C